MNRREILKYTSLSFGLVAAGGAMSALLSGCKVEPKLNFTPEFLSVDEVQSLTSMVDIIFPKTSTPSASEVGVTEFIDATLANVADVEGDNLLSDFWKGIKGDTYFGYFSSEKVAKEVLVYLPVPGPYVGCVDLMEATGGKTWAY